MTSHCWLDLKPRSGPELMALDHAMLELSASSGIEILRLYRWDRDTISFGANEAADRHWDRQHLEVAGIPCVRRPTGGRAVWHDTQDLTYSVSTPLAALGDLRWAYRAIHQRIASAFASVGIEAHLAPAPATLPGLRAGACFDLAVGGELVVNGRKAVGSAQLARNGAMLQHGAIARADRLSQLNRFRKLPEPLAGATVAPDLPLAELVAQAIASEWQAAGATPIPAELTDRLRQVSLQHTRHYTDPGWTWRR